jgi:hypothetical protein
VRDILEDFRRAAEARDLLRRRQKRRRRDRLLKRAKRASVRLAANGARRGLWLLWYERLVEGLSSKSWTRVEDSLQESTRKLLMLERSAFVIRQKLLGELPKGGRYQLNKELRDLRMRIDIYARAAADRGEFAALEAMVKEIRERKRRVKREPEREREPEDVVICAEPEEEEGIVCV